MLSDTWYLFNKYVTISLRAPLWLFFNLIQPLIWLVIFGSLFGNMAQLPGFPADSYTDFFVPGVLIMTVLFGSSWCGISLLREIRSGTVDKMLVAPTSRAAIVISRILHSSVQVMLQSVIILLAAWLLGASVQLNVFYLLVAMILVFILGVGFAALSNGLAMMLQREEPLVVVGNLMTLPLMFFSSAMVPESMMPEWIRMLAMVNPIEYAVDAVRQALSVQPDIGAMLGSGMVLSIFSVAMLAWAISTFNAMRE